MNVHDEKTIRKMIEHINRIQEYTNQCSSLRDFSDSNMRVEACVFNLVQIGELAHSELSDELKKEIDTIPWKQLYGLRNRIVHGYDSVDMSVVWETIRCDIEPLRMQLNSACSTENID